jgi:methionyl-tRNA formyltransferase
LVSHCKKIKKSDGLVEFNCANNFYDKYRAYKSWPDIYLDSGLKIKECSIHEVSSRQLSNTILEINKTNIVVACTKGSISITLVQPSSKKAMCVVDYIRGKRLEVGDCLQ